MWLTRPSCQGRERNEAPFGEGGAAGELLSHKLLTILFLLLMKVSEKDFFSM